MTDPARHATEALALRALARSGLPVPQLVHVTRGSLVMTLMPGDRLDGVGADERLAGLRASAALPRRLHRVQPPDGLPGAPDDALIIRRYREAGGPSLPLSIPPAHEPVFCHGDWTDDNLLAAGGTITAVLDWEAAHAGDPIRELSRAAWAAARKDPRVLRGVVDGYGADLADVQAWSALHAAELWLWFLEAGPPEYLDQLTEDLLNWSKPTTRGRIREDRRGHLVVSPG